MTTAGGATKDCVGSADALDMGGPYRVERYKELTQTSHAILT